MLGNNRTRYNVLLINHYLASSTDPGSSRHYDMAVLLKRYGFDFTLVGANFNHFSMTYRHEPGVEMIDGIKFLWLGVPPYSGGRMYKLRRLYNMYVFSKKVERRIPKLIAASEIPKPDLIVGTVAHPLAAEAARRLAKRYGVPFVLELRDLWPQGLVDSGVISEGGLTFSFLKALEAKLIRSANLIVVLSNYVKEYIRTAYGADAYDRCVTYPNGLDFKTALRTLKERPLNGELLELVNRYRSAFKVAYAGSLSDVHASDRLIDVAKRLQSNVHLFIIGGGPLRPALELKAQRLNISNVTFIDPVPRRELWSLLSHMDLLLILAKVWGSSNKLADYLVAGKPILFSIKAPSKQLRELGETTGLSPDEIAGKILLMKDNYSDYVSKLKSYLPIYREKLDLIAQAEKLAEALLKLLRSEGKGEAYADASHRDNV